MESKIRRLCVTRGSTVGAQGSRRGETLSTFEFNSDTLLQHVTTCGMVLQHDLKGLDFHAPTSLDVVLVVRDCVTLLHMSMRTGIGQFDGLLSSLC